MTTPLAGKVAVTSAPILPLLAGRWSPRAYDPSFEIPDEILGSLFEAARWSPSANNMQPWRFAILRRGEPLHAEVCSKGLMGFNQVWVPNASVLVLVLAEGLTKDGKPNPYARFDTGLAVSNLIVQAEDLGISAHLMAGIHAEQIRAILELPASIDVIAAMTLGRRADPSTLQGSAYEREVAPRTRLPLETLLLHGKI